MDQIKIMINGAPGNVATSIVKNALKDSRFEVLPWSLTGPEITDPSCFVESLEIRLVKPDERDRLIDRIRQAHGSFISVDYTHPTAINENAEFYCRKELPFVMGTTGGDREKLHAAVEKSTIPAVIAPNMAKQIVGFQAMMEYAAHTFPDLFKGYTLEIQESHQPGKADTSGTAKAMVGYFNKLGIPFSNEDIFQERDPENQKNTWGIPEQYIAGHAWHTYSLTSPDQTVNFVFKHNVNGREIYSYGTFDAVVFLAKQIKNGEHGKVFTMIDVLKG